MVTRKKQQTRRPGLLSGPSRKQYDTFTTRTGDVVKPEKHNSITVIGSLGPGTDTFNFYTVPTGKEVRILYLNVLYRGGGEFFIGFTYGGSDIPLIQFSTAAGVKAFDNVSFIYENAPVVKEGGILKMAQGLGSSTSEGTIIYVEESIAGGYFSN